MLASDWVAACYLRSKLGTEVGRDGLHLVDVIILKRFVFVTPFTDGIHLPSEYQR